MSDGELIVAGSVVAGAGEHVGLSLIVHWVPPVSARGSLNAFRWDRARSMKSMECRVDGSPTLRIGRGTALEVVPRWTKRGPAPLLVSIKRGVVNSTLNPGLDLLYTEDFTVPSEFRKVPVDRHG